MVIGDECSIWFGAVLRADLGPIRIGAHTNIQDNCVIHSETAAGTTVGERVTVGHGAVLHDCVVGDGSVIGIGRRGNRKAQLLRSKPPYTKWQRTELDRYIGGPLLTRWGDRYVVGGRKRMNGRGSKTSMCWLLDGQLHEFAELPSGGDTSYPGFVELDPRRAIMSWYSSHERDARGKTITAIYMADLRITEKTP